MGIRHTVAALSICLIGTAGCGKSATPDPSVASSPQDSLSQPTDKQVDDAVKAFQILGARLERHPDEASGGTRYVFVMRPTTNNNDLTRIPDLPFLFAMDLGHTKVTDTGLKELARLKNLSGLQVEGTEITGAGLEECANLKHLSSLFLRSKVNDVGTKGIAKLADLANLDISGAQVTDLGMKELARLTKLSSLHVGFTNMTDAGLKELSSLKNLKWLNVAFTKVTNAGVEEFQKTNPGCRIVR
jgi:internalin A